MNRRELGRTGIGITPIGLGTWQFSGRKNLAGKFWGDLSQETADAVVAASLEGGVNWFDTAYVYGRGHSEETLAAALRAAGKKNGDVVVATKWWPVLRTSRNLLRSVDDRIRHLSPFAIDLYQVHHPWGTLSTVRGQMRAMAGLLEEGRIRAVGVSNFSLPRMERAAAELTRHGATLASNQVQYSLLHRKAERTGLIEGAGRLGVTVIAYSPLAQGVLTGAFHDDPGLVKRKPGFRRWQGAFKRKGLERSRPVVAALREVAANHGCTPAQAALAWTVTFHGEKVVAIPGASKAAQAESNAAAMDLELSPEELSLLDEVSRPFL